MYKIEDLRGYKIVRAAFTRDGTLEIELNTGHILRVDDGIGGPVTVTAEWSGNTTQLE